MSLRQGDRPWFGKGSSRRRASACCPWPWSARQPVSAAPLPGRRRRSHACGVRGAGLSRNTQGEDIAVSGVRAAPSRATVMNYAAPPPPSPPLPLPPVQPRIAPPIISAAPPCHAVFRPPPWTPSVIRRGRQSGQARSRRAGIDLLDRCRHRRLRQHPPLSQRGRRPAARRHPGRGADQLFRLRLRPPRQRPDAIPGYGGRRPLALVERAPDPAHRPAGLRRPRADAPPLNLVFLVDTSGSMMGPDRLPWPRRR
ncbi:hypothetical protein ACRAWD_21675 [Caulobacter segnis]